MRLLAAKMVLPPPFFLSAITFEMRTQHLQCGDEGRMRQSQAQELYQLSVPDALRELRSSLDGLSEEEAAQRLTQSGHNRLIQPHHYSWVHSLGQQFTHFLALLLWLAAALAFIAEAVQPGEGIGTVGYVIVGVIAINAVFASFQEYKAERAMQALHLLLPTTVLVVRDGKTKEIAREMLVPGDVLLLEEGNQVPADARLIEASLLRMDDSALTGESKPKRRTTEPQLNGDLYDVANLIFAGTTVMAGRGKAVVYATGMKTQFGQIAQLTTAITPESSPLQREIAKATHIVAALSCAMGAAFFVTGVYMGLGFWISAIFGIGIIAANVPEGLLPTVTLSLAMASQRMAKRKALIKHLPAVETLGCATVICTDKTGTLTENRMTVDRLYIDGEQIEAKAGGLFVRNRLAETAAISQWQPLFEVIIHCNNARRVKMSDDHPTTIGDPTEVALMNFAAAQGLLHDALLPRLGEFPFDADRRRMTTLHRSAGSIVAFTKGAPETVLPVCGLIRQHGRDRIMTDDQRQSILTQSRSFAEQAYRVLAVASRRFTCDESSLNVEATENELVFLGLVALLDPPHREVPEAIVRCKNAGIRIIMITGDHPLTALAIARKIGLLQQTYEPENFSPAVIEGQQIETMTDEALRRILTPARAGEPDPVFARMTPRHKLRVVSVLKEMEHVVGVTGDGINDAPALKKADIGIAMGIAGADVTKEVADMVLLDDNFATIVNAIEEGRTIYANIQKFVAYVFSSNFAEMVPYLGYGLFCIPVALTVPQILAIDLGTNMVPALGLGAERPHAATMTVPPRSRTERLLSSSVLLRAYGFLGPIEALAALGAFFWFLTQHGWSWGDPLPWSDPLYHQATTVTFAAIVIAQIANVFVCRSDRESVFQIGFFGNGLVWFGISVELFILALALYTPAGNLLLGTAPLPLTVWPVLLLGALLLFCLEEGRKLLIRHSQEGGISGRPRGPLGPNHERHANNCR